jgi:hypothetical protein
MNGTRTTTAQASRHGRRRHVAKMAPPKPRPRREQPADLDDRSLFSSAHALECTAGGYTWR